MRKWLASLIAILPLAGTAVADDYPSQPVTVVVPLAPGGGTDTITRYLAEGLHGPLGAPVVIENKGGAGTRIGMAAVARSEPDGYTFVVNGDTAAIFEFIFADLTFDAQKDFVPVAYFASAPIVLAAHPSFEPNDMKELIALAKQSPGEIAYATPGNGTPHDLAGLLMMQKAGIELNKIPYRGNGPAMTDLLGGQVQIGMFTISNVLPYLKSGELKVMAVVGDQRTSLAPELPSMAESGLAGVGVSARYVMLAPAGTPPEAVAKLHGTIMETVKKPETAEAFRRLGYEPMLVGQEEAVSMFRAERERWRPILELANIKPE